MRPDLAIVAGLVPRGSRVLDLGCGDGELLAHLLAERGCDGLGVENDTDLFHACMARGVPVIAGDIDEGLGDFGDRSFDVVVLSLTLQATHRPAFVLAEIARVGRRAVVSFPNFGHWRLRLGLGVAGRMPSSPLLPYAWHDTPNIHLCTVRDFEELARTESIALHRRILLDEHGDEASGRTVRLRPNLLAAGAVYLLGS